MKIIITSPSLDVNKKVAGISSVTRFIISNNPTHRYVHFELGKNDNDKRGVIWLLNIVKIYFKWVKVLLQNRDAVLHFNIAFEKASVLRDSPLIVLARLLRSRMIIHLHGGEYLVDREMPFWMRVILKCSFSKDKHPVVSLSPLEEKALEDRLSIRKLFVLPNCVDVKDAEQFKRCHQECDGLKLLFLGRISEKKGIEFIYLALKTLKERGVKFKFTMAGTGEAEETYLLKFSELLGDAFEFKGVVFGEQKTQVLKDANVFLLPSFYEGLPMALLEGMSFGLVPITTDVGSIKHVILDGKNGILVEKCSSDDIVRALQTIDSDRAYMNRLSGNARDFILENYKPKEYVSCLNQIYQYE